VTNAMDDARHAYYKNKSAREWKYFLLDFSDDHELSSKEIYDDSGGDTKLKLEVVPIQYKLFKKKQSPISNTHWACWQVARTDIKSQKHGKVRLVKEMSEAAAHINAMHVTDIGLDDDDEDDDESDGME
jgi:hypothetical protein